MALTVVVCVSCLLTAFGLSKLLGYDIGTAAGLLAGAFSESTVIGTASGAIQRLAIPDAEKTALLNNIPVAYAVTYLIGTASLVWFLPTIGPKLMRINLKEEGAKMQAAIAGAAELGLGVTSAARFFDCRAYRVTNPDLVNKTVAQLEALPQDARIFIARIRRAGEIIEATPDTVILQDDVVAVMARQEVHVERGTRVGPEVDDKALLEIPIETLDVVVTHRSVIGKTLAELGRSGAARGVFLKTLTRAGQEIPISPGTVIDRGDMLSLVGAKPMVEYSVKELGYADRPTTSTDMVFVGTGIVIGGFIGLLSVKIGGLPLSPHRQRRRADHGTGVRLVAVGVSVLRTHPRAGDLDLRYRRVVHLHRRGRPERGPQLLYRAAENRHQPGLRGAGGGAVAAHFGNTLWPLRAEDGSAHRPRRMLRSRDDHRCAARDPGRGPQQCSGPGLYRALCDRQHPVDGMGSGHRGHDVI